jgi:MFS family permease
MVANLPAGLLSQGVGHSGGMAAGAMLLALGALVTAAAAGYHALLLGSVLIGGGESLFNIGTQALVRNPVGGHMHGRTLSVLAAIPRWATIVSPVLGSFLVSWIGWPAPFVALAALAATAAAVVLAAPTSARSCAASRKTPVAAPSGMTRSSSRAALAAGTARLRSTAAQHWRAIATGGVVRACADSNCDVWAC